jgi:probable HAF family extracellular repeat protein
MPGLAIHADEGSRANGVQRMLQSFSHRLQAKRLVSRHAGSRNLYARTLVFEALETRRLLTVTYGLTDLGTLPGGSMSSAQAINSSGQVVGGSSTASGNQHAFLYSNGTMYDLGVLPGGNGSSATGINDNGVITGSSETTGGLQHAFLFNNGVLRDLGTLPGARESYAMGINNSGQVVGEASFASQQFPAILFSNGTVTNLGTLAGPWSSANAINDVGVIAGSTDTDHNINAFVYSNGVMQDIGTLPHGTYSNATGINDAGQIAGYADNGTGTFYAFLYSAGTMKNLGTLPGGLASYAQGINTGGEVVGYATLASGAQHAFLYAAGAMTDLNSLIDPSLGWDLENATAINDNGQIVGSGVNSSGQLHAFLLTPISKQAVMSSPPPAGVLQGSNFGVTVQVLNAQSQVDTSFNGNLTIALATNPGNSTLSGVLTVPAVHGVATFSNLKLNNPALGYRLQVSGGDPATSFVAVVSAPVDVAGFQLVNANGVQNLDWFGTNGNDHVQFTQVTSVAVQITTTELAGIAINNTVTVSGVSGILAANGYSGNDTLDGGGLTNTTTQLIAGDGNNTLIGGASAGNTITAGNGNNTIYGTGVGNSSSAKNGNNTISVGDGNNLIYGNYGGNGGEGGNNTILAGNGNNTIYGNAGGDAPGAQKGGNNSIQVGSGKNTIYGNFGGNGANGAEGGNNIIVTGDGQNTIYGNFGGNANGAEGGNNTIVTGDGPDTIYGNFGGDGPLGGDNLIIAGGGNDTIYAHSGLPTTSTTATTGQDLIIAGKGTDKIYGWGSTYNIGSTNVGDLVITGTSSLNISALQAVLSEWASTDSYALRLSDIRGLNGTAGVNGSDYLIPGTTVFGSTSVDQIFGTANTVYDWYLVTTADILQNVSPSEITLM